MYSKSFIGASKKESMKFFGRPQLATISTFRPKSKSSYFFRLSEVSSMSKTASLSVSKSLAVCPLKSWVATQDLDSALSKIKLSATLTKPFVYSYAPLNRAGKLLALDYSAVARGISLSPGFAEIFASRAVISFSAACVVEVNDSTIYLLNLRS